MISVVSRWRWVGESRPERVRLASGDGGAVVLDSRARISLLDASGAALWTRNVEDSVRDIGISANGKDAYALSVREIVRFGSTGKAVWRVRPAPFPVRLAVRRDGEVFAVAAGQGLVRIHDAQTGRDLGGARLEHHADFLALLEVELAAAGPAGFAGETPTLTAVVGARGEVTMLDHMGQPHWTVRLGANAGPPDAAHDRIVVPSFDGVHCFLLDGTPGGLYDVGAPVMRAYLDHQAARLLVLDAKSRVFLLSATTGETLWHLQLPEEAADISFAPDGSGFAVALRGGAVEHLQILDGGAAMGIAIGAAGGVARGPVRPPPIPGAGAPPPIPGAGRSPFPAFENPPIPGAAPSRPPPGAASAFLEMDVGPRFRPQPRWRVPVPCASPRIAIVRGGEGVALLDADRGELSLWTGLPMPAWRAGGLGPWTRLGAADAGNPIVVAGPSGVRFFSFEKGPLAAAAPVDARMLAVAESGAAVLVGSSASRLHLFDGGGRPVWDVPTPGFRRIGISPRGQEMAIAREDGAVIFQVRGRRGGWSRTLAEPGDRAPAAVEIRVLEDGVVFATASGRAGFLAADGSVAFDARIPGNRPAAKLVPLGPELLLRDASGGWSRMRRSPWSLEPLPNAGAPGGSGGSRFALPKGRLVEFRFDAREIASLDATAGNVLWRRALDEAPKAVAAATDGTCLAAYVSGELVLYDLVPVGSTAADGSERQRFLEL